MPRLIQERKISVPEDVPTARDVGTENKAAGPVTIPKMRKMAFNCQYLPSNDPGARILRATPSLRAACAELAIQGAASGTRIAKDGKWQDVAAPGESPCPGKLLQRTQIQWSRTR